MSPGSSYVADYFVKLCDGTERTIEVKPDAIAALPYFAKKLAFAYDYYNGAFEVWGTSWFKQNSERYRDEYDGRLLSLERGTDRS